MKAIKNRKIKAAAAIALAAAVIAAGGAAAFASSGEQTGWSGGGRGNMGGMPGGWSQSGTTNYASEPTEVLTSDMTDNTAEDLTADVANAETIVMSADNNNVKISKSGTYIVTGTCADGNLAVKKGTTGVVLILKDLDLTSTTGATVSLNKGTEVKVIIEGNVTLTDKENIEDEESDDFDGAALKAKVGSSVVLTGTGTLTINGACKHGIKVSGLDAEDVADGYGEASFVIDGKDLTINITAEEDGLNSGNDLTIKSGTITVSCSDDGIKADYILTIGGEGTDGPTITVSKSDEAIEGAIINIYSGNIDVTAADDGLNAANKDLEDFTYSLNIMGGTINITAGADGIDSNGNVNILGGLTTIVKSASNGGEGGLDYEGSCYVKDGCLVNPYGTTFDSGTGSFGGKGGKGGMQAPPDWDELYGEFPGWTGDDGEFPDWDGVDGESGATPQMPDGNGGRFPGWDNSDGSIPEPPDGVIRDENGNIPSFPGGNGNDSQNGERQTPPDRNGKNGNGQAPGQNGEAPAEPGQDGTDTQDPSGSSDAGSWFRDLWESIKNWFSEIFNR